MENYHRTFNEVLLPGEPCNLNVDIDIDMEMNPNVNVGQTSGHFISVLKREIYSLKMVNVSV